MRASILALLLLSVSPAAAQEVGITIFEHGIYTAETVRTEKLPSGFNSNIVQNICHVVTTEAVPARLGVQFGFRYRVDGEPKDAIVELKRVTRFPIPLKPPGGLSAQMQSAQSVPMRIGSTSYVGYGFDHDWELVNGSWAIEVWQGHRLLARQRFEIGEGEAMPDAPRSNNKCFELSASLAGIPGTGGKP